MGTPEAANHEKFLAHLSASGDACWLVSKWLQSRGYPVRVNPTFYSPEPKAWKEYADGGDIEIGLRIEVKGLSAAFTSDTDWPFPNFIVCAKHSFDRSRPRPYAYIAVNEARTHIAMVKSASRPKWTVERKSDGRYQGVQQEFYVTTLNNVSFHALREIM